MRPPGTITALQHPREPQVVRLAVLATDREPRPRRRAHVRSSPHRGRWAVDSIEDAAQTPKLPPSGPNDPHDEHRVAWGLWVPGSRLTPPPLAVRRGAPGATSWGAMGIQTLQAIVKLHSNLSRLIAPVCMLPLYEYDRHTVPRGSDSIGRAAG